MKKIIIISMVAVLQSCAVKYVEIGDLNMASTRNISSINNYEELATYVGQDKKSIKKSKSTSVESAINKEVAKVAGGEIMKNIKIYVVKNKYIAVSGDVWGVSGKTGFKGFEVGENVIYTKNNFTIIDAEILSFINSEKCIIRYISNKVEYKKEVYISKLSKK